MGILSGIISFIIGLLVNLLDTVVSMFLESFGFSLDKFEEYFPAAGAFYEVFVGLALGISLLILVFQLFKNMGVPLGFEAEEPVKLLFKFGLYFGLILYSRSLTDYILQLLTGPFEIFMDVGLTADYNISVIDILTKLVFSVSLPGFMAIVYTICVLILMWEFLKLLIEALERYIVMCFIIYTSPLALAMGPFKGTSEIFRSWCRMFGSQAMLILLNVWSVRLFVSYMGVFIASADFVLLKFFMGYAFLKFAQKIDTLLRIVGLNTAAAGGDTLRSLGSTVGSMVISIRAAGSLGGGLGKSSGGEGGNGGIMSKLGSALGFGGGKNADVGGIKDKAAPANSAEAASDVAGKTSAIDRMTGSVKKQYADAVLGKAGSKFGTSDMAGGSKSGMGNKDSGGDKDKGTRQFSDILDKETNEGLSNLAHGLPHKEFDAKSGKFSGGGFGQYTGKEANLIGANQMPPADGFKQSTFKAPNGENSVLYGNPETGEAYAVNFSSVDNGVITGSVQEFDAANGQLSSPTEFSAVHQSVTPAMPEIESSNVVGDGGKGSYVISSEANTSFFAPPLGGTGNIVYKDGSTAVPPGAASGTPDGAASGMGGASARGPAARPGPSSAASAPVSSPSTSGLGASAAPIHQTSGMGSHEAGTTQPGATPGTEAAPTHQTSRMGGQEAGPAQSRSTLGGSRTAMDEPIASEIPPSSNGVVGAVSPPKPPEPPEPFDRAPPPGVPPSGGSGMSGAASTPVGGNAAAAPHRTSGPGRPPADSRTSEPPPKGAGPFTSSLDEAVGDADYHFRYTHDYSDLNADNVTKFRKSTGDDKNVRPHPKSE